MKLSWISEFKCPSSRYRAKPFWAWNGKLEETELRRQLRLLGKMGFGGFFMHSRVGLATPYLSKEWFDLVRACVGEAKKNKMEAWLYDEDRWPSGAGGGFVTRRPEYRMKYLEMKVLDQGSRPDGDGNPVALFDVKLRSGKLVSMERVRGSRPPPVKSSKRLAFAWKTQPENSWYNGQTYLDVLNPEAVKEFIRVTHEAYRGKFRGEFGRAIPGIFTDEPNFCSGLPQGNVLPWTQRLPQAFRKRYGYDLLDHLPEIFFQKEGDEFSRVRYHYVDCLTWLFTDSFSRQIGEWCGKNKLLFTGHVLAEDSLSSQARFVGSAMRFYEHMQAPGMDLLTEYWRIYDTAKQVSSVARQLGRRWRLTETDGCTGWDFSFAGHKALGDWQAAMGINVRCPHLSWYTMEGQAKRDYPASIFYQSPWWKDYRIIEDYFARIHAVMTRGGEIRDLLVISPIESLWGAGAMASAADRPGSYDAPDIVRHDLRLKEIRDALLSNHIDFDYGDEEIMAGHGRVSSGAGTRLVIGKASYKAVLVPPATTIRSTTLILLKRFRAAGGQVVFLDKPPAYVDALPSKSAAAFAGTCTIAANRPEVYIPLLSATCRRVSINDGGGREVPSVLHLLRSDGKFCYLFACNTGHNPRQLKLPQMEDVGVRERTADVPFAAIRGFGDCRGAPMELDPATGKMWAAQATRRNGEWEISTSFPALGSRLFVIPVAPGSNKSFNLAPRPESKIAGRTRLAPGRWQVVLSEANCLALDRPRFKIGKSGWKGPVEILRLDRVVRDHLGLKHRGGAMVQPWVRKDEPAGRSETVELEYEFFADALPRGELCLAVERPGLYSAALNGVSLETGMDCGWWVDRSCRKLPLPAGAVKKGRNVISLRCKYDAHHPGFEIIYILGEFGVRILNQTGHLTAMPMSLKLGNWCPQGLPFYPGSVGYVCNICVTRRAGQQVAVNVPGYLGAAVKVWVDGQEAGYAAWPPSQVDITRLLKSGKGRYELRIEVLGHRRNSHGPLHHAKKHPAWTGPYEFVSSGKLWTDKYQLVPCGLTKPPEILTLVRA